MTIKKKPKLVERKKSVQRRVVEPEIEEQEEEIDFEGSDNSLDGATSSLNKIWKTKDEDFLKSLYNVQKLTQEIILKEVQIQKNNELQATLTAENQNLSTILDDLKLNVGDLSEKKSILLENVEKEREELESLTDEHESLIKETESNTRKMEGLRQKVDGLQSQLKVLTSEIRKLDKMKKTLLDGAKMRSKSRSAVIEDDYDEE